MALNPQLRKMIGAQAGKYRGAGDNAEKPKDGRSNYRLLWPTREEAPWMEEDVASGMDKWWQDLGVHWIKASETDKPIAVVGDCEVVYDRPSPITAAIQAAINSAYDEETKKLYESWRSRTTVLLNVLDRTKDQVVVLELTKTTFGKIMDLIGMYADNEQDITDRESGMDIVITKTGKGLNTNYDIAVAPGASKPVPAAIFNNLTNLKEFVEARFFRGEEQKALNAISQIAGIPTPQIGHIAATSTPTAALSSPAASVAPVVVAAVVAAGPTPAELEAQKAAATNAALQAQIAALQAQVAAPVAAAPVVVAPVVAPVVAAVETPAPTSGLDAAEQQAILDELAALG
jgi:hypothetical protein